MANIKDIAKLAGVSVTTVSRVLNNHPYVSEEKKEAVRYAMEQSNYRPNINAVHLSKGKTNLIGVVIPFINHPYFGLLVEGIANEAVSNNYKLVLFQTNYEEERELEALLMLKNKQIDGLVIGSRICHWEVIKEYIDYGPIVVCEDAREQQVASTYINHYESFSIALEYLHRKAHNEIGYCIGRKSGSNSTQRDLAYRDFLAKNNIDYNPSFVFSNCFKFEDGVRVVDLLTTMKKTPSALLVTSDQVAAGILTCCRERNIQVPHQLAIMGFDNQPIAKIMNITTLEIPIVEIGRSLFRQALESETVTHNEIAVKLIERLTV
ncbi:LacI family DNA-binding transcriptional regulator [Aquibacillus kalidii]|uniref:LacI family DNA-binding transcriptional regulator n=1 Tax=Aquibacillus kalidii TaxID=2762597 RepID=UPI001647DE8A|nr:LacI family DNA-binding transcriptional regulator [Aquibacillus kalidii]